MTLSNVRRALVLLAVAFVFTSPGAGQAIADTSRLVQEGCGWNLRAGGRVRVKHRRDMTRITVRVRRLAPRSVYFLVSEDDDLTVGAFRTNRRGTGRAKLQFRGAAFAGLSSLSADDLSIWDAWTEARVLVSEFEQSIGSAICDGRRNAVSAALWSLPGFDSGSLQIVLSRVWGWNSFRELYEFRASSRDPEGLPFDATDVAGLEGREFEVVDAYGEVVYRGMLGATNEFAVAPAPVGDGIDRQPFTVFLADEDGVLQELGEMKKLSPFGGWPFDGWPFGDWPPGGWPFDDWPFDGWPFD